MKNKDEEGRLVDNDFCKFLQKITAFIFCWAITNPGVNALRTPVYDEMVNIVDGGDVTFGKYKINLSQARTAFENYSFNNQRNVTRSMLTWYAYTFQDQEVMGLDDVLHLEHIYSRKRQQIEQGLSDEYFLESLGNKVLLEANINIRASDYRFEDKKEIYTGRQRRGSYKQPSQISEVIKISDYPKFEEAEICNRNKEILDKFFDFLHKENLIA